MRQQLLQLTNMCDHTSSSAKEDVSTGGVKKVLPVQRGSLALGNLHAILGKEGGRRRKVKSGQEYNYTCTSKLETTFGYDEYWKFEW